jgi:hypothetical protein
MSGGEDDERFQAVSTYIDSAVWRAVQAEADLKGMKLYKLVNQILAEHVETKKPKANNKN